MAGQMERDASLQDTLFEVTDSVFSLRTEAKEVFDALVRCDPQLEETFADLQRRIPLFKSTLAGVNGRFFRLPNHNRSFCYSLSRDGCLVNSPVIVVKGAEPLLGDFPLMIDWMLQAPLRKSSRVMTDHFPLAEGKIPGALSRREGLQEARIALDVQRKHLLHYGELARIPIPLLVHSLSEQNTEACAAILRGKLSPTAFDRIESVLHGGLAIYLYHYPTSPIRANCMGDLGAPEFRQFAEQRRDEELTVSNWSRLLIRLLYLGYLPYSVRNEGLGACMDFGNAAIDGGFCDPDSILALDAKMEDEFVYESIIQTFKVFQNTVERFLDLSESHSLYPSLESFLCGQYVQYLLKSAIASEQREGLRLDARFVKLMFPETVSDIRGCTRRNRAATYANFARRYARESSRLGGR